MLTRNETVGICFRRGVLDMNQVLIGDRNQGVFAHGTRSAIAPSGRSVLSWTKWLCKGANRDQLCNEICESPSFEKRGQVFSVEKEIEGSLQTLDQLYKKGLRLIDSSLSLPQQLGCITSQTCYRSSRDVWRCEYPSFWFMTMSSWAIRNIPQSSFKVQDLIV